MLAIQSSKFKKVWKVFYSNKGHKTPGIDFGGQSRCGRTRYENKTSLHCLPEPSKGRFQVREVDYVTCFYYRLVKFLMEV